MVKRMFSSLSVLTVLIVLLAACSGSSDYTNVIPADASMVVSVSLKSIVSKAGLGDKENEAAKQKLMDALKKDMSASSFEQLEAIIKDPKSSGIDIGSPIYLFSSPALSYPALVAKISKEDQLVSSLEAMEKEQFSQPILEGEGYRYAKTNGGMVAFNKSAVLMIGAKGSFQTEKVQEVLNKLFQQTAESSIAQTEIFKKMEKLKGDINYFSSLTEISAAYRSYAQWGLPAEVRPEDVKIIGELSFEKGKIALQSRYYTESEAVQKMIEEQIKTVTKANNTFSEYFPASTLAFFNAGVKGNRLYEQLSQKKEFRQYISETDAAVLKELMDALDGDVSIGLVNVTLFSVPTFVMYADMAKENVLDLLYQNKQSLKLSKGDDLIQLDKQEYVYKSTEMNIFFGIKDKKFYATNDELLYKNIGKKSDRSVKDTPYASDLKGKPIFFAVNMQAVVDLPVVKLLAGIGNKEDQMHIKLADKVSYFSVSSEGETGNFDIYLKDKDTNALKQITDFARQFVGMP